MDSMRNLRFTLRYENKEYVLDEQIPIIDDDSTQKEIEAHQKHYDDANKVSCIMTSSLSHELQKTFGNTWAYEINQQLKEMFQAKASKERLDIVKSLMACKPKPGASICAFVLEMKGYFDKLGLKESRRLKHGELNLVMGNRKITPVIRIGKYELMLKSGVRINSNNCCYSSEMTRNIISFHALFKDGYKFSFDNKNGDILVYLYGCFMFKASLCKYIYETVECISHKGNVILNVGSSNELDKLKLWHSHLGHVNKKHIAQLQKDGVLELFDFKSDDACESCLLGKMTKSPFTGLCEIGEGLLDLVHTDVCGPFRSATKDGKRYYVTTPQLNGVTERRNRTLLDMVRSMMSRTTLPISFWGYTLETAAHILNLVPTKKVSKTPFETWKGKRHSLGHIKIWVSRSRVFPEREMISKEDSGSKIDLEEIQEISGRVNKSPRFYYGFLIEYDKISDSTLSEFDEPANYKEAMASLEAAKWKEAMKSEIQSMYDNQVWNLVDTTLGLKTVGLAKIKSIRILLAIAAFHDYEIRQMDVKTAFLNGNLTDDVFMVQPEGFKNAKYPKRACKLKKAIYGLKQASRSCHLGFHEKVTQFGFSRSEDESCIYVKVSGSIVVFLTAVKNILKLLRNTKDRFLVYGGEEELRVTGYCDASWKTDKDESRSQSGWVFLRNGGAVTWKSSKQDTVADSTCESIHDLIEIFCDNESAVALTKETKDRGKSKHIERKYHFVRSKVEKGHVIVKHIRSEDNPADPFTKALAKSKHDKYARSIGFKDNIKFWLLV
nr:hypothetical protein [Tanacetum cinerariifolium]